MHSPVHPDNVPLSAKIQSIPMMVQGEYDLIRAGNKCYECYISLNFGKKNPLIKADEVTETCYLITDDNVKIDLLEGLTIEQAAFAMLEAGCIDQAEYREAIR